MRAWTRAVTGISAALTIACAPPDDDNKGAPGDVPEPKGYAWKQVDVSAFAPRWGSFAIERDDDTLVLGGVSGAADAVLDEMHSVAPNESAMTIAADVSLDRARYCHCAMLDDERQTLVVIGGRGANFNEIESAVAVDLSSGASSVLEAAGAADTPVGCQAMFFPALGRGYVFGGLSGARRAFGSTTYRYDAAARTFTALDIEGPQGRYDAATHVLDDGTALMVGGMGLSGVAPVFFSDVWRFDPVSEAWSELPPSQDAPAGRRYPWTAVSPDESTLIFGFGSDSGMGNTVLADLWAFSLGERTWSVLEVNDDDGAPAARGFTFRWKGTDAMAGVIAHGFDGAVALDDGWALVAPTAQTGRWH